ncbi:DgyrCDS391 [Dimorphilus gyrociliatus]|uniref:DgyrCDS391 n=1 Tax=Dimorphilus gyrociliatus TaxID=2664684 RepID=A0A7I8V6Y9_9ANNE|nr:DgyrCDS391 [Dimorphilus gyrociliatus]
MDKTENGTMDGSSIQDKSCSLSKSNICLSRVVVQKEVNLLSWVDLVLCACEYLRNKGNQTPSFNDIATTIDENSEFLNLSKSDSQKERLLLALSEAVCRRLILQCKGFGTKGHFKLIKFRETDNMNLTLEEDFEENSINVSTKSSNNLTKSLTTDSEVISKNCRSKARRQSAQKRVISDSDSDSTLSSVQQKKGRKFSPQTSNKSASNSRISTRAKPKPMKPEVPSDVSSDEIIVSKSPIKQINGNADDNNTTNHVSSVSEESDGANDTVDIVKFNEYQGRIIHSQPKSMEEILPLALIFQSEPKIALLLDIVNFMKKRYGITSQSDIEKALARLVKDDKARKKGNKYELAVSEFSPEEDQTLEGKIINAIVATHKPCIAVQEEIRSYMNDFHPDIYDASDFAESLKRACKNDIIKMTEDSKIKLAFLFEPTPEMLRGEDSLEAKTYYE